MMKQNIKEAKPDIVKWILVAFLLVAGFVANYYFIEIPLPLRIVGWLILTLVLLGIAYTTSIGGKAWKFFKEARQEMRKVVWPTRQETLQTSLIVIAMVIVIAIFLWGIDMLFMWLIARLTS